MCRPGNSGLDVFKLNYFTHSVAVSWEFFICLQPDCILKTKKNGYFLKVNKRELF